MVEKPLSILLLEDEPKECQDMVRYIEGISNILLVGVTNNEVKGLEYLEDFLPDAVILDLELHKGYGNGLSFLDSLRETCIPVYILVTTNNISPVTHASVRNKGADFIMVKSQEDYGPKMVIDFLLSIKSIIHSNKKTAINSNNVNTHQRKRVEIKLNAELDQIGIPPNAVGRTYLFDAIIMVINGQTKKLRETISAKYDKSEASVERAMQNAIGRAWSTTDIDDLVQNYTAKITSSKGVPTVMEFIHYYARKLK